MVIFKTSPRGEGLAARFAHRRSKWPTPEGRPFSTLVGEGIALARIFGTTDSLRVARLDETLGVSMFDGRRLAGENGRYRGRQAKRQASGQRHNRHQFASLHWVVLLDDDASLIGVRYERKVKDIVAIGRK